MSKVVFFCIPAHGHINPTLALAEALVQSGEEVIYYCSPGFVEKISRTGAHARAVRTSFDRLVESEGNTIGKNIVLTARLILEAGLETLDAILDDLRREDPDYIVTDSVTPYGKAAAKILGKPYVCTVPIFCMEERGLPRTPWGTEYAYLFQVLGSPREIVRIIGIIRKYRKKYRTAGRELFMPFSTYGELNIVTTSRAFQFYEEKFPEERFTFTGPLLFEARETRDFPVGSLEGRKTVYISMGTIYNKDVRFYGECFDAFGGSEYTVVMSRGGANDAESGPRIHDEDVPANFIVREYVPQLQVLPHIGAFVTNCGMNSVNEAFYFGVPLVCVPQAADQFMIGKRARDLGAAVYLEKPDAVKIRAAVDRIFGDPAYRENAVKIGRTLKEAGGIGRAAEAVLGFGKKANGGARISEKG